MNYFEMIRLIKGLRIFAYENEKKYFTVFGTSEKDARLFIYKKRYKNFYDNKIYNFTYYDNNLKRIRGNYYWESKLLLRLIRKDFKGM